MKRKPAVYSFAASGSPWRTSSPCIARSRSRCPRGLLCVWCAALIYLHFAGGSCFGSSARVALGTRATGKTAHPTSTPASRPACAHAGDHEGVLQGGDTCAARGHPCVERKVRVWAASRVAHENFSHRPPRRRGRARPHLYSHHPRLLPHHAAGTLRSARRRQRRTGAGRGGPRAAKLGSHFTRFFAIFVAPSGASCDSYSEFSAPPSTRLVCLLCMSSAQP